VKTEASRYRCYSKQTVRSALLSCPIDFRY